MWSVNMIFMISSSRLWKHSSSKNFSLCIIYRTLLKTVQYQPNLLLYSLTALVVHYAYFKYQLNHKSTTQKTCLDLILQHTANYRVVGGLFSIFSLANLWWIIPVIHINMKGRLYFLMQLIHPPFKEGRTIQTCTNNFFKMKKKNLTFRTWNQSLLLKGIHLVSIVYS